jgi:general secretion pathway protein C
MNMTSRLQRWAPATTGVVLWLLAGLAAGYWGLQLLGRSPEVPVPPPATAPAAPDGAAVARALGALGSSEAVPDDAAPLAAGDARHVLQGVVGDRGDGVAALIAVAGRPARPFRIGMAVDEGLVLHSVQGRTARLAPSTRSAPTVELRLPDPAP